MEKRDNLPHWTIELHVPLNFKQMGSVISNAFLPDQSPRRKMSFLTINAHINTFTVNFSCSDALFPLDLFQTWTPLVLQGLVK